jgi:periplasmic protein TonB
MREHPDLHLLPDVDWSWRQSFFQNLKELIRPPQLPPIEITAAPVPVKDIWGQYGRQKKLFLMSIGLQAAAVAMLFTAFSSKTVQEHVRQVATLVLPLDIAPPPSAKPRPLSGGGGGGDRSPLPAGKGRLPKPAIRQFVPPSAVVNNAAPRLTMDVSILAPPEVSLPSVNLANYGDPLGKIGPPSNGTGSGGGIGSGKGGGVGSGSGGGVGPGEGGGIGGGIYRVVTGASQPVAIYRPDPEYSDDARKAHLQGTVGLDLIVDEAGRPRNIRVVQSLGLGLDEAALKAAAQWRFKPAMKDGKPVPVTAHLDVGFHLL